MVNNTLGLLCFCSDGMAVPSPGKVRGKGDTQILTAIGDVQLNTIRVVSTRQRKDSPIGELDITTFESIEGKAAVALGRLV